MSRDSHLKHAVLSELNWEPRVDSAHIGVTAEDDVVTLTGHVESYAAKKAAEAAAQRVKGVRAVVDEFTVRLAEQMERSDEDIAAAAVARLGWDVSVPPDAVKICVERGWVTLRGEVEWHYQKHAAEHDVRELFGVVGVTNLVTIKPAVNVSTLSDDITHALNRSWFFDPQIIKVSAQGGKVRLTGTVKTPHDRQVAAATAWSAPGVTDVENEIVVERVA